MARKPARSKPRNDAIVELGDAQAQQPFALTVMDLTKQVFVAAIVGLDAETRKMHSERRGVSSSDFDKLPPRYKKSIIERRRFRSSRRSAPSSSSSHLVQLDLVRDRGLGPGRRRHAVLWSRRQPRIGVGELLAARDRADPRTWWAEDRT
jgi:hypothetical protein